MAWNFIKILSVFFSTGIFNGFVVPLLFCLLPNKQQSTYEEIWETILSRRPNIKPETVMMDFERAVINSFKQYFPNTIIRGCFFHLNQSVYRQVQKKGLKKLYEADESVALQIKMLCALAYIPQELVVEAFEMISEETNIPVKIQPIMDYFEDTYIGRPSGKGRRPPLFEIGIYLTFFCNSFFIL